MKNNRIQKLKMTDKEIAFSLSVWYTRRILRLWLVGRYFGRVFASRLCPCEQFLAPDRYVKNASVGPAGRERVAEPCRECRCDLKNVLTNVKVCGTYGEVQLALRNW
jgi:hypothetical protein